MIAELLAAVGLLLFVAGLIRMSMQINDLADVTRQNAERIAQLELDVQAALVLARKRLTGGRSGR